MIKYKYLRLNKYKKLRYLSINNQSKICIVFLHGFMSDIEGKKPKSLLKFCIFGGGLLGGGSSSVHSLGEMSSPYLTSMPSLGDPLFYP